MLPFPSTLLVVLPFPSTVLLVLGCLLCFMPLPVALVHGSVLGQEKRWQEQLGREECMVQQLNKSMYILLNFAVMVYLGYVYGIASPRTLYA